MEKESTGEDSHKRSSLLSCSDTLWRLIRGTHHNLDKLISSRLPLALPPQTDSPQAYVQGLAAFGRIFEIFEQVIAQEKCLQTTPNRIQKSLASLSVPGIRRTERLQCDITELQSRLHEPRHGACHRIRNKMLLMTNRVTKSLEQKPHLALAYAWSMYLALFNGGKYIRRELERADVQFWLGPAPLSFWYFEGRHDGIEIHDQFKGNFENAARQLTDAEWEEVCDCTVNVFGMCEEIVALLDSEKSNTNVSKDEGERKQGMPIKQQISTFLGYVFVWYFILQLWVLLKNIYASTRNSFSCIVDADPVHEE